MYEHDLAMGSAHQKDMVGNWKQIACEMGGKIGIDLWGFKLNE